MGDGCTRCTWPRRACSAALTLLAVACTEEAPPQTAALAETERPNYAVRLDSESGDVGLFDLVEDDDGIRVQTGPAGIAYRADDVVSRGNFRLEATFVQYAAPVGYREAYGIFVGGIDLDGAEQEYTYLLVRPTGDFLIKRRLGDITETLVDWTPHEAVARVDTEGDEPRNTLGVDVAQGTTVFVVNGVAVHTVPIGRARPYGIAGVRVNHRLDVRVDDWFLGRDPRDS